MIRASAVARAASSRLHLLTASAVASVIAAGLLWAVWLGLELSGPLTSSGHHDFFALYAAATLVRQHRAQLLYSPAAMTALERQIFAHPTGYAGYMPFLNPPAAAALLAPLSLVSEPVARIVWLLFSLCAAAGCIVLVAWHRNARVWALAALAMLWTFPAYQTFVEGQWSFLMLGGCLLAVRLARRGGDIAAGVALAALWLKPPLVVLVLLWLLLTRRWRLAASLVTTVLLLTLVTLPFTGIAANTSYLGYLVSASAAHGLGGGAAGPTAWEGAFANMEGVLGLSAAIAGQQHVAAVDVLTALLSAALIVVIGVGLRHGVGEQRPLLRVGIAALLVGLLLDPHLYAQDCILLVLVAAVVVLAGPSPSNEDVDAHPNRAVVVLVLTAWAMDLSAIDTLWSQGLFPLPLHLLTIGMIISAVTLALPRVSARQRLSEMWTGVRTSI